jgi:TonB family protein
VEEWSNAKRYDHTVRLAVLLLATATAFLQAQEISSLTYPSVIHRAEPEYTKAALDTKLQGTVILSLVVGVDGVPSQITVVQGLGMGLDKKAVKCLKRWRFKPATNHGEPIPMKVKFDVNFHLPIPSPPARAAR